MKKIESESLTYTQQEVTIGNRKTNIIIGKKPGDSLDKSKVSQSINKNKVTIKRKKCSGCSRRRRG